MAPRCFNSQYMRYRIGHLTQPYSKCGLPSSRTSPGGFLVDFKDIVPHRLGERPALSNDNLVARASIKARRAMGRDHLVALLITTVLFDEMQIIPTNRNCVFHEGPVDNAPKGLSANAPH